jgi:hypothetical protein
MSSFIVIISVPARISNPIKPRYQKNNIVEREEFLYFLLRYFKECIQKIIKNNIKIKVKYFVEIINIPIEINNKIIRRSIGVFVKE